MPLARSSSFPIPIAVELDFRPDSYVADWCALAAIVQNVTGEHRRQEAFLRWRNRPRAGGLMPRYLADTLEPEERARYVAERPAERVSGEHLPPYLPGELEIARLVVHTTPKLVVSLRARASLPPAERPHAGRASALSYGELRAMRLVDEQGSALTLGTVQTLGTLSLRELILLLDGARATHLPDPPASLPFPESLVLEASLVNIDPSRLPDLVEVSSTVYPELHAFYRTRLHWWVRARFGVATRSRGSARSLARTLGQWWAARKARA